MFVIIVILVYFTNISNIVKQTRFLIAKLKRVAYWKANIFLFRIFSFVNDAFILFPYVRQSDISVDNTLMQILKSRNYRICEEDESFYLVSFARVLRID